jgi:hypothetical protein
MNMSRRKWLWPNLKYYPGTYLSGLRGTTNSLSQNNWPPGRVLNPRTPQYEAWELHYARRKYLVKLKLNELSWNTTVRFTTGTFTLSTTFTLVLGHIELATHWVQGAFSITQTDGGGAHHSPPASTEIMRMCRRLLLRPSRPISSWVNAYEPA